MRPIGLVLLALALLMLAGGCDAGGTNNGGTSDRSGPSTSAAEAAQIKAEVAAYNVVFGATSKRAVECERLDAAGVESYDSCFIRSVRQPNDDAGLKLAQAFATLEPLVDPRCAQVLAREAKDATNVVTAGDPTNATAVCRPTE
jgi:hypothetical protein